MTTKSIHTNFATFVSDPQALLAPATPPLLNGAMLEPLVDTSTSWALTNNGTAASGDFNTATNWSNGKPGPGTDATIIGSASSPITVTITNASDTADVIYTSDAGLSISNGTLVLQGASGANDDSNINSSENALIEKGGLVDFQNGPSENNFSSISGSEYAVEQTSGIIEVDAGTLNIYGNSIFDGTLTSLNGLPDGGTIQLLGSSTYNFGTASVVSVGVLNLAGGGAHMLVARSLVLDGGFIESAGTTLDIAAGKAMQLDDMATPSDLLAGTVATGSIQNNGTTVLNGATFDNNTTLTNSGTLLLNTGGGTTALTLDPAATILPLLNNTKGHAIDVLNGTYSITGGSITNAGSIVLGNAGGLTVTSLLTNTGAIAVAAGDVFTINNSFTNTGTISGAGTLILNNSAATISAGSVLTVAQINLESNNPTLNIDTGNLKYAGIFYEGGNFGQTVNLGSNTFSLTGQAIFDGTGRLTGSGTLALSGATTIAGYGFSIGEGTTLTNSGTVTQVNTVQIGDTSGGVAGITNSANGTWKLTANNLISTGINAASSFTNAGLLENVGNNAAPVIDAYVNNTGTIAAVAATTSIALEDGGTLGGTLSGAGTIALAGGTFTVASTAVISVANLEIETGGTSVIFNSTVKPGSTFTQAAGTTIDLAGTSTELGLTGVSTLSGTITGTGYVAVGSTSASSVDGLTLDGGAKFEDYGGVVSQGGSTTVTIGLSSNSTAALVVESGSTYRIESNAGISGYGTISNAGVLEKYEGTSSEINVLVNNTGKLEALSGTLDFAANVTNTGTASAVSGNTIQFGANLSSTTGEGVITLSDGGLASFGGYVGSSQTLSFLDTSTSEATISMPNEFAASIKGFGGHNALFLSNLSNVTGTYAGTASAGTLTLTEQEGGDTVTVAQLNFAGDYALDNFSIVNQPDGVLIDYTTPAIPQSLAGGSESAIGAASSMLPQGANHF